MKSSKKELKSKIRKMGDQLFNYSEEIRQLENKLASAYKHIDKLEQSIKFFEER